MAMAALVGRAARRAAGLRGLATGAEAHAGLVEMREYTLKPEGIKASARALLPPPPPPPAERPLLLHASNLLRTHQRRTSCG